MILATPLTYVNTDCDKGLIYMTPLIPPKVLTVGKPGTEGYILRLQLFIPEMVTKILEEEGPRFPPKKTEGRPVGVK